MPFDLKTPELLTIIGWGVTFTLGVIATTLAQRLTKQRKRISWSLVNESSLLSEKSLKELSEGFHVPIKIIVNGNEEEKNLSTLRVKVANTGNVEVENIKLHFSFGENTVAYVGRYLGELGVYKQSLHLEKNRSVATLKIAHINIGQSFEVEFLVAGYHSGDFSVDMAAPGVTLKQTDQLSLEVAMGRPVGNALSIGMLGVTYEPTATQTSLLVGEVRELRRVIEKAVNRQWR